MGSVGMCDPKGTRLGFLAVMVINRVWDIHFDYFGRKLKLRFHLYQDPIFKGASSWLNGLKNLH